MQKRIVAAFATLGIAAALAAADHAFPPDMSRYETLSTEVVAADGALLRPFVTPDGYWRLKTTPHDVSPRYLAVLKAYEDQRFESHFGIDPLAVGRAALQYAGSGHIVSGASTLTMQAARLLEPHRGHGWGAKILQATRALQLELRYSKDEILGIYLTLAPFGGNLEGVRAASLAYFGKEPKALTLAEAALLVALPQSPEGARPDRNPKRAFKARDKVLARLTERAALPADEAREARNAALPPLRLPMPLHAPRLAQTLKSARPNERVIATTLAARLQSAAENMTAGEAVYFEDGASVAVVVVKTSTREVLVDTGGVDFWGPAGHVDLAAAKRSPGSALKPLIYGLAFDDLALHPETLMDDQETLFGDYAPGNFGGSFHGTISARTALRESYNVPAVMVLERVGPVRFTLALEHAGAKIVFPANVSTPSLPIALGGLGISLRDMTMLYAGLASGGEMLPLRETLDAPKGQAFRFFGPTAAYYLRDILDGVSLPDGFAMGQGLKRARDIGFKTGTSYGYRDAWALGYSNDYTVGVWVGRPDGAPRPDRLGRNAAGPILLKMFDLLPPDRSAPPLKPKDAITANSAEELPPSLRYFARTTGGERREIARIAPPAISFPHDGSVVSLKPPGTHDRAIALTAEGGHAPFTWMVNGEVLGSFGRYDQALYVPDGEGVSRITVVDAEGQSATARVRFKKARTN